MEQEQYIVKLIHDDKDIDVIQKFLDALNLPKSRCVYKDIKEEVVIESYQESQLALDEARYTIENAPVAINADALVSCFTDIPSPIERCIKTDGDVTEWENRLGGVRVEASRKHEITCTCIYYPITLSIDKKEHTIFLSVSNGKISVTKYILQINDEHYVPQAYIETEKISALVYNNEFYIFNRNEKYSGKFSNRNVNLNSDIFFSHGDTYLAAYGGKNVIPMVSYRKKK